MANLTSSSSPAAETERPLTPARALLTPTWIASLALLATNDHLLKGSELLPGVVTGKLSDFAGMIVAPVLLAALLRVRSRRALLACHVAVGAVFAGIQLSTGFAGAWSALMGLFGHPWVITSDPSDLVALPFLGLAWHLLVPQMDGSLSSLTPLRRTAVAGLSVFGLWSTVATSDGDPGIDFDDTWYEDVSGNLFINNANDHDIALYIRPLRPDVQLDCLQVAQDPGRLLRPEAFGEAEHWLLPPRTNVGIDLSLNPGCKAVWVAGEGIAPTVVFVDKIIEHPSQWWSGQSFDPAQLGSSGMGIVFGENGSEWVGGEQLRFVPRNEAPEQPEACEPSPLSSRIDWSPVSSATNEILSVESGVDGCFELSLLPRAAGEQAPEAEAYSWYLCAPEAAVSFEVGEVLDIRTGLLLTEIIVLDPETLEPARNEQGLLLRHVRYYRGVPGLETLGIELERNLVAVPTVSCPWSTEAGCATVERATQLAVAGAQSYLNIAEPVAFGGDQLVHTAVLAHASERAVVDAECSSGATQLSYDIDMAIIDEPL